MPLPSNRDLALSTSSDVVLASAIVWIFARLLHPRPALIVALWVLMTYALDLVDVYDGAKEFGWATAHKKLVVCTAIQTFSFSFAVWVIFRREMGRI